MGCSIIPCPLRPKDEAPTQSRAPCLSVFPRQQQALQEALLNSLPGDEQPKSGGKDGFTENRKEPAGNAPKKDHTRWILVVYN